MKKNVVLMQHLIMAEPDDDQELDSKLDMPIVLDFIRL